MKLAKLRIGTRYRIKTKVCTWTGIYTGRDRTHIHLRNVSGHRKLGKNVSVAAYGDAWLLRKGIVKITAAA